MHNELLCIKGHYTKSQYLYSKDITRFTEDEILKYEEEHIREQVHASLFTVLGGIGFSGLSNKYNATTLKYGKYFDDVPSEVAMQRDIEETKRFDALYRKLLCSLSKTTVIVLTHMEKDNWNEGEHNPYWIYVSGHTHHNKLEETSHKRVYADNQIGYKTQSIGLKRFYVNREYDIFAYYEDGIHEISKTQYQDFNKGKI